MPPTKTTSIGDLPMEVLEDIVLRAMSEGPHRWAPLLATVHPTWQMIVERRVFNTLVLRDTDAMGAVMETLRRYTWRFEAVEVIRVPLILPSFPAVECTAIENSETRFQNDLAFSRGLGSLLRHLAEWPATPKGLELRLFIFSPSDVVYHNQWHIMVRHQHGIVEGDIGHMRTFESTLEWLNLGSSIEVPNVTKFGLVHGCQRYISAKTMERLHQTFTGLKFVDLNLWDIYKIVPLSRIHPAPHLKRRTSRRAMVRALAQLPSSLDQMHLHIEYLPPANQSFPAERTIDAQGNPDELTSAWRRATQKLSIVRTTGMLWTPELFWPRQTTAAEPQPFWPRLKQLSVLYHIVDPAGDWVFEADQDPPIRSQLVRPRYPIPPAYGHSPEDAQPNQFRFTAIQEKMDKFYATIAKAVTHMPKLESLHAQAITFWGLDMVPFHAFWLAIDNNKRTAEAIWIGSPRYEPSHAVLSKWRAMAYTRDLALEFKWDPFPPHSWH
ncbi:hypothetical protein F5Y17DRAFT_455340 [Xylariaceae sp. FL0594]|nr:hypothetical protein F5Y17DRAFT_455340 [Xylariaceae sp. FL0594]